MKFTTPLFAALVLVPTLALVPAEQQPDTKTQQQRAEYIQELEKLKREKPSQYYELRLITIVTAEMLLGRLGYNVGPFDGVLDEGTQAALRTYQKNRSLPVNGDPLSFETREQMRKDFNVTDSDPVTLPSKHVITEMWDRGYVSAQGTWTITGGETADPEQTSTLECDRARLECVEATATISHLLGPFLSVATDTYEIERWDSQEIVTKPKQFGCVRSVRRLNRVQKSATGIRSTTSREEHCKMIDNAEKYLVLVNGMDVSSKLSNARREQLLNLVQYTPDLRKKLATLK